MEQRPAQASWAQALRELGVVLRLDASEARLLLDEACRREPARCRRCGNDRIWGLRGNRLRCAECGYSFMRFTGRWLGLHRLPARTWLAAIKCFELGLRAPESAKLSGLSGPTAARMERTIQMALAALDPSWAGVVRACASGREVPRRFAIRRRGDAVKVETLPETDGGPRIDLTAEGWSPSSLRALRAAARRWVRLRPDRLALRLKEFEWRSNTQGGSLFNLGIDALARYMPAGLSDA